ncbi:hypothetical protein GKR48_17480 [Providencia sp. wls1943]|uniref:hypothetical protein n=1 Tax=unclassified Providencia TaxID=2633465 RepID=UPI0012B56F88|nr:MULTISPECIES: hypothetical protein [unclassified Providencia]MTB68566.1 hypothetical protein [Providencia sp. wls1943]
MKKQKSKFNGKIIKPSNKSEGNLGIQKNITGYIAENNPPNFSLRYLQKGYCLDCCEKDEKAALSDKLFKLSQITWAEIKSLPRHGLGFEKISRSCIKSSIPPHITDDVELIAFRFCAKKPMVGYRKDSTFYLIWLDRTFKLYNHT